MKHLVLVVLVLVVLLVPAQPSFAQDGCHLVNHTVGRVYLRNGTSRVQTLSDVARRYRSSASDIAARNGIPLGARLMIGQSLVVLSCVQATVTPRQTPIYLSNPCRLIGLCSQ